ncbi:MAG: hypothetical protein J2P26_09270 [Nocardiopsaceae bacterium]|nr:hypothetical protein [Nocardiopsaceae bacterium]
MLRARPELTHLQCRGREWAGMLFPGYDDLDTRYRQMADLAAVEVDVSDPHTRMLNSRLDLIREAARTFDPDSLLNPGKLPPPCTTTMVLTGK